MKNEDSKTEQPCTIQNVVERIFNRWTKWEVYKSDLLYTKQEVNTVTGWESEPQKVYCDVLKRVNKFTGMIQYKTVQRG